MALLNHFLEHLYYEKPDDVMQAFFDRPDR
jgi:hypothetical protein